MDLTPALLASLNVTRKQFAAKVACIVALCASSDKAVKVACIRIFDKQTSDEQHMDATVHDNGVGFQYMDAKFGGKMARLMKAGEQPYEHNMPRLRRMARKYRVQLAYLAFRKEQAAKEAPVAAPCCLLLDLLDRRAVLRDLYTAVAA